MQIYKRDIRQGTAVEHTNIQKTGHRGAASSIAKIALNTQR